MIEGRQGNKNWTVIACANLAKANLGFLVKQSESGFEIWGLSETKQSHSQTVHTHLLGLIMFRQTVPAWYRRHAHKAILHGLSFLQHTQLFLLQILLFYDRTIEPITQKGGLFHKGKQKLEEKNVQLYSHQYVISQVSLALYALQFMFILSFLTKICGYSHSQCSISSFFWKILKKKKKSPTFLFISFCMCVCICIARLCGEDQWQLELWRMEKAVVVTTWRMLVKQMGFFGLCEGWADYGINPIFKVQSLQLAVLFLFCFAFWWWCWWWWYWRDGSIS